MALALAIHAYKTSVYNGFVQNTDRYIWMVRKALLLRIYLKCVKQICVCGVHKFVFSLCSIFQARFPYLYYYYNFARILFFIISAEIITRIVVVGIYHQVASWWALMRCISYRYMCS